MFRSVPRDLFALEPRLQINVQSFFIVCTRNSPACSHLTNTLKYFRSLGLTSTLVRLPRTFLTEILFFET